MLIAGNRATAFVVVSLSAFSYWIRARIAGGWRMDLCTRQPAATARGRNVLWGFVALIAVLQVYVNFGPPPASETMMAIMALSFYVTLAAIARSLGACDRRLERHSVTIR
jgi:hypothetical protein